MFLKNNTHYGQSVKSIRFEEIRPLREKEKQTLGFQLASMSQLPVHSEDATDRSIDGAFEVAGYLYFKLVSLQTLTINQSILIPRKFRQLRCFESSLKKVWIALVDHSRPEVGTPLNAKNVIWLLGFGVIHEASFGFTCSYDDSNFLEEHHSAFAKISKVKKLSLRIRFVFEKSNKRTWWELPTREPRREYQKTTAVKMILGITNGLECCEVLPSYQGEKNPGDFTQMDLNCFAGLTSSFKTLQHLRILGVPTPIFNDYRLFNCLRTLSVDSEILQALSQDHSLQLPDTLERIILTYYQVPTIATWSFKEDTYLVQLLKAQPIQSLPNFKEVVVPLVAIDPNGNLIKDRSNLRIWSERRKELESEAIFKSGRVTMRKCGPGQNGEFECIRFHVVYEF